MKLQNTIRKANLILVSATLFYACKNTEKLADQSSTVLDTLSIEVPKQQVYRASRTKHIDILHEKLVLSFNWDSAFVNGEATITLKPYFYPIDKIELDARQFKLHRVAEMNGEDKTDLKYSYDYEDITIDLGREITANDTITLYIKYTAMPDKIEVKGSSAITEDKGMYFINKDNSEEGKPRQLWTQGETEANSCWFPTIDSPNEKFTHEIYVTIEEAHTSISNGLKMFSLDNGDGTKTEYWKMDKENTVYLVMLAVGPFAEYKDKWNDMQVNYYLDSSYLKHAKAIFGNTPEMLTFYSDYLGVTYPWQKYDQVVVHDYVSGAMENTTATIHGDFLLQTERELKDYNNEDVIAHELFHHWFGDLVTCESWSNLTLNEGFATYGEYLWEEYKYGRDVADIKFQNSYYGYLNESAQKKVDMIRFYYDDKEDMFDSHSYAKGGLILHMLRHYVGNEAFRASLKYYLNKHAYQNVEIHDLRIAFEHVTGEDLNWFFNQWFLASGHPVLNVRHEYEPASKELVIYAEQKQDLETTPLYRIPVKVNYGTSKGTKEVLFNINKASDTLVIENAEKPSYVNFNPGRVVLAELTHDLSTEELQAMYRGAELAVDKERALEILSEDTLTELFSFYNEVKEHDNWAIRQWAFTYYSRLIEKEDSDEARQIVYDLARNDEDWRIRYLSTDFLKDFPGDLDILSLCLKGLNDPSILVEAVSLSALIVIDSAKAGENIQARDSFEYSSIAAAAFSYYAMYGTYKDFDKVIEIIHSVDDYAKYQVCMEFGSYLSLLKETELLKAIPVLKELSLDSEQWWIRMASIDVVLEVHERLAGLKEGHEEELKSFNANEDDFDKKTQEWANKMAPDILAYALTTNLLEEIKTKETRANLASKVKEYLENQ